MKAIEGRRRKAGRSHCGAGADPLDTADLKRTHVQASRRKTVMAANDEGFQGSPISGEVLFYQQPEPLDAERHKELGMKSSDRPFAFANKQHFVPLHVTEFGPAAVNYPIIFAGAERLPLAIMGLTAGENLYISEEGVFRPGAYIPAFIRRYPFVGAMDDANKRSVVCIDRKAPQWVSRAEADVMLFEDGQPSQFTKNCIEFCSQFDTDRAQTAFFIKLLIDNDLFEPREATYATFNADGTPGEPQKVSDFFAVSDAKLKALAPETLVELRDNGALQQIFTHIASLYGWEKIIAESVQRRLGADPAVVGRA